VHHSVCDFLLDLLQNSIEAGAGTISLRVLEDDQWLEATVTDDGKGMDAAALARAMDPFRNDGAKHPGRRFGLGIPFLVQALDQAGGWHRLESIPGAGTCVRFAFPAGHVDSPCLGDLAGCILAAMCFPGDYELQVERMDRRRGLAYRFCRSELADAVGGLREVSALALVRQFLISQEAGDDAA